MLRFALLIAALALALPALAQPAPIAVKRGALTLENVPEAPRAVRDRLRQYTNTRSAGFFDFLPSGGVLIGTRFTNTVQIHSVAMPMGDRRQLTFFEDRITSADARPGESGYIMFAQDSGGDENFQGYLLDPTGARYQQFTEPGTRNEDMTFSRDGARIAWVQARKDSGDYDIYVCETGQPYTRKLAHKGTGALGIEDWSPDGEHLLVSQYISIAKSRLFVLKLADGALTELTPELTVSYTGGEYAPDGKSILTISDENSEFGRLTRIDLASSVRTVLSTVERLAPRWDVERFDLSPDGRTLAYSVNVDGASDLQLLDLKAGKPLAAPKLPPGVIGAMGWDEKGARLALSINSATSPTDVYVLTLKSRSLVRWTQSETGGLNPSDFIEPKLQRFRTFDSAAGGPDEISAWVYEPKTPGPHAAIIDIHGGPESQSRPTFSSSHQYWVRELDVAVIVPNVRGSTGYGKTFVSLDNERKRLDSVKDIGAVLDWMASEPRRFDMSRIVPYGGSYGGYMVYAAMIMFPERFAAGIDIVGIGNLRSFLENTSGYRRALRRPEYGDERDPEISKWMEETASLNNVGKIKSPMFIIHGENDPRVPVSEARAMVGALRAQGLETWLMTASDEGHGFAKKANQEAQREAETLFLMKTLNLKPKTD